MTYRNSGSCSETTLWYVESFDRETPQDQSFHAHLMESPEAMAEHRSQRFFTSVVLMTPVPGFRLRSSLLGDVVNRIGDLLEADRIEDGSKLLLNTGEPVLGPIQAGSTFEGMLDEWDNGNVENQVRYYAEDGYFDLSCSHSCIFRRRYLIETDKSGELHDLASSDSCRAILNSEVHHGVRNETPAGTQELYIEFEVIGSEENSAMLRFLFQLMQPETVDHDGACAANLSQNASPQRRAAMHSDQSSTRQSLVAQAIKRCFRREVWEPVLALIWKALTVV